MKRLSRRNSSKRAGPSLALWIATLWLNARRRGAQPIGPRERPIKDRRLTILPGMAVNESETVHVYRL